MMLLMFVGVLPVAFPFTVVAFLQLRADLR